MDEDEKVNSAPNLPRDTRDGKNSPVLKWKVTEYPKIRTYRKMLNSSHKYKYFHKIDVRIICEIVTLVHGHEQDKVYCRNDQTVKRLNE